MKRFSSFIAEASFLKPDYVIGHKVAYNGKGFKELSALGYKAGDHFEIIAATKADYTYGDGPEEKYLKAPNGKVIHMKGSTSFKSSSFTHVKTSGSPPTGAEWEDVIVYAYNKRNNKPTDPETIAVAEKFSNYMDVADKIAGNFNSQLKAKQLVQTGRGMGAVSLGPIWKETGAKNKTPKTDIASSDFKEKISLKKAGGSQLASPTKAEAIAIVKAAMSEMGEDRGMATKLVQTMETNMSSLVSRVAAGDLRKQSKAGVKTDAVIDFQKKDKGNRELTKMLEDLINQDTAVNALFSKHVVLEAATGNHKFGTASSPAAANLLGKFTLTGDIEVQPINSIKDSIIIKYAQTVKPVVSFKSGGGGAPAYSALRLGIKESETLKGIVLSEMEQLDGLMLTEDFLSEGPLDMLKNASDWAKDKGAAFVNKVKAAVKNVLSKVTAVLKKIAKMGKKMFASLMKFLGVDVKSAIGIPGNISL
tara:strand:+ start:9133 stop:10560 length:1428 start_codon:yes stop_codon:yes gene_type:complete